MENFFTSPVSIVNLIATIILGVLFVSKTWKSQSSEIDRTTIESLKRQAEAFERELHSYRDQVNELTLKVGEQKGIIDTQKDTIIKYEKIFANRNPELTQVLGEIRDFMKVIDENTKKTMKELNYQTSVLNRGEERAKKLDTTHKQIAETL